MHPSILHRIAGRLPLACQLCVHHAWRAYEDKCIKRMDIHNPVMYKALPAVE